MKIIKEDGSIIYHCEVCNKEFSNQYAYSSHCRTHKPKYEKKKKKVIKLICDFCGRTFKRTSDCSCHERRCKLNPNRIETKGHPNSIETRQKISQGMKKAHKEDRAYVWKHRKTEPSPPEKWLIKVLKNEFNMSEDVDYVREKPFHKYFLDFYFPISNLVIEMDGSQNKLVKEQIETDKEKDKLLEKEGYNEIRLYWPYVCSNAKDYVEKLKIVFKNFNVGKEEVIKYNEKIEKERLIKALIKLIKKIIKKKTKKKNKAFNSSHKKRKYEDSYYIENNKFDSIGRANCKIISTQEWENRKQLILDTNIDLMKFGYLQKLVKAIPTLSKRQIEATLIHFNIEFNKTKRYKPK